MTRLLDLFCGAGGAAMGYHRAGFDEIIGVDNRPMPHYPFTFVLGDALEYSREHGTEFDAIHASPPCQKYGKTKHLAGNHPQLIEKVRDVLTGKPYVIENVPGAPLINPIMLTAAMFGMNILRDRLFECTFPVPLMLSPTTQRPVKMGRPVTSGDILQPVGHFSNVPYAREQMGIDWMTQAELAQAIPPAYTEYIGKYLMSAVELTLWQAGV